MSPRRYNSTPSRSLQDSHIHSGVQDAQLHVLPDSGAHAEGCYLKEEQALILVISIQNLPMQSFLVKIGVEKRKNMRAKWHFLLSATDPDLGTHSPR